LSELTVEVGEGAQPTTWSDVEVTGHDLDALAYGWLNELIGCAEVERRAIAFADVTDLSGPRADGEPRRWRLCARVGLVAYEAGRVHALRHAKAVTFHGLRVGEHDDGWSMEAVVDL
jgi:SHS2 domain-containing protein